MEQTARFALPQLAPGQMQKEFFHNEALQTIDMMLCASVDGPPEPSPPANPVIGSCFLVSAGSTGAWSGQDGALACFTEGGWRLAAPIEGMRVLDRLSGQLLVRRNGDWEAGIVRAQQVQIDGQTVLRDRQPAIADPVDGNVIDLECRSVVAGILTSLRAHGLIA